jgi:hypothetical protein
MLTVADTDHALPSPPRPFALPLRSPLRPFVRPLYSTPARAALPGLGLGARRGLMVDINIEVEVSFDNERLREPAPYSSRLCCYLPPALASPSFLLGHALRRSRMLGARTHPVRTLRGYAVWRGSAASAHHCLAAR